MASSTHCQALTKASGMHHPTAAFPFLLSCGAGMGCVRSWGKGCVCLLPCKHCSPLS